MKTKEEILATKRWSTEYPTYMSEHEIQDAMDEYAKQQSIDFAQWLSEMTTIIHEEKITLYRYCNKMNEWGNYTLGDIYLEYQETL